MDTAVYHRRRQEDHHQAVYEARMLGSGRLLRDDEPLTEEITAQVIQRYRDLLTRLGKSDKWASRSLDISSTTLSQVLSGKYEGDTEARIFLIDKWTADQIAREQAPRPNGFAKTSVATAIYGLAKDAKDEGYIGVCIGPSGVGKTFASRYVMSEFPNSIYIRVSTPGAGAYAVCNAIAAKLKVPTAGRTAYQLLQAIVEILEGTDRLLIVDEAHKLCKRHKDQGLHTLRDIQDMTGIPMLWFGTEDIKTYTENPLNPAEAVEQIFGRVGCWLDLAHAASQLDGGPGNFVMDDLQKVAAANDMRIAPDGVRYLTDLANQIRGGGLRSCVFLCRKAIKKYGTDVPIARQALVDLQEKRLGKRTAHAQATSMELQRRKRATA